MMILSQDRAPQHATIDFAERYASTTGPLVQLTYVSRRLASTDDDLLINILLSAAVRNFLAGISAKLWVSATHIVQTLEGKGDWGSGGASSSSSTSSRGFMDDVESQLPPWPMRILLGAFIFGIIGLFTVIGVLTPGVGWFLYVFLIPFWAMFPIIVVGVKGALVLLVIYVIGYPIAKLILSRQDWYVKAAKDMKSKGSTTIGGFVVSSGGSSSGGYSSSSGGGFSGGGGSSGGGGASGSW